MKKHKNGFTLIELLVVIVLIISILGLAIVSVNKLSERQKKNALKRVKEQVVTAAEQYFSSNEYLFEGIEETGYAIITVGKLVEEDYLNKLTDPTTGNALNNCDKVQVKRSNDGKYSLKYIGSDGICADASEMVLVSNDNPPTLDLEFTAKDKNGDRWFNKNELMEKTLKSKENGLFLKIITDAIKVEYCVVQSGISACSGAATKSLSANDAFNIENQTGFYDKVNFNDETDKKNICYVATSASEGKITKCKEAGVDITPPNVTLKTQGNAKTVTYNSNKVSVTTSPKTNHNGWYTGDVSIGFSQKTDNITDESNLKYIITDKNKEPENFSSSSSTSTITKDGEATYYGFVKDEAGNVGKNSIDIKKDATLPECSLHSSGYTKEVNYSSNIPTIKEISKTDYDGWYTGTVKVTMTTQDTGGSGLVGQGLNNSSTSIELNGTAMTSLNDNKSSTYYGHVIDGAGNINKCNITVKKDSVAPSCTLQSSGKANTISYSSGVPNVTSSTKTNYTGWYTGNVSITFGSKSDNAGGSGISKYGINNSSSTAYLNNSSSKTLVNDTSSTTYYGHIIDAAGNTSKCNIAVKKDATGPTCPSSDLLTYTDSISSKNSFCIPEKSLDGYHCTSVSASLTKGNDWKFYTWDGGAVTTSTSKLYSSAGTYTPKIVAYDEAGNSKTCTADKFVIDKTRPNTISVTNTPTICQTTSSNSVNLPNILKNFSSKSSSCNKKFQYVSGAFNGTLEQYSPNGSFWLYLEFKSSDNTGGSGLVKTTSSNYVTDLSKGWEANYQLYNKNNSKVSNCLYTGNPCKWSQSITVYDRAGNYTSLSKSYSGIKY